MAKIQHIHKFKKLRYKSGNEVFFCTLPDCNQKINPALALGKKSICWRCGESFILTEYSLRLMRPHCDACHKPKKIEDKLDDIIKDEAQLHSEPIGLSLAERLQQTIQQAQEEKEEDEI